MIEIVGAPFDLGGAKSGTRLGPDALRSAGLVASLANLGYHVFDRGNLPFDEPATEPGGLRNFRPLANNLAALRKIVAEALRADRSPLILGGEHTMASAGISAALERYDGDLAILWIDAHADLNEPGGSQSGNLHGMPVAALLGIETEAQGQAASEWKEWLAILGEPKLTSNRAAWLGLRDVDDAEKVAFASMKGPFVATMHDVDRHGMATILDRFDAWMKGTGARNLWISFDVDALDPFLAPGTGTAVRGGLTFRESQLCAEALHEWFVRGDYRLAGVDLVETNPLVDTNNETAQVAVTWVSSLFGKTILGSRK